MTETYLPYFLFALTWAVLWLLLLPVPDLWRTAKRVARHLAPRLMARPRLARAWERGRARMGPLQAYLPTIAIVAIGIVVTVMIGEDFVELAVLLRQQSPVVLDFDQKAYAWAASMRSPASTTFFLAFTVLGSPIGLALVAIIEGALLIARRHRGLALYVIVTASMGGLLNQALKAMFARARPDLAEALRNAHGYSFPSGHSMGSMIVLGAIAYVVARTQWSWRWRVVSIALLVTSILTIGISRAYLGVHWSSDIAAGFAAGLVWLVIATVAFEVYWRIRQIRGERMEP